MSFRIFSYTCCRSENTSFHSTSNCILLRYNMFYCVAIYVKWCVILASAVEIDRRSLIVVSQWKLGPITMYLPIENIHIIQLLPAANYLFINSSIYIWLLSYMYTPVTRVCVNYTVSLHVVTLSCSHTLVHACVLSHILYPPFNVWSVY